MPCKAAPSTQPCMEEAALQGVLRFRHTFLFYSYIHSPLLWAFTPLAGALAEEE